MSLRRLMEYMIDERQKEAPLFKELREKYPDFGEQILTSMSYIKELTGFGMAKTWPELVEHYTGHKSAKITKLFLSKLLIDQETTEYEYGIDKILSATSVQNFFSGSSEQQGFTVRLDKKKTKKMIDRFLLKKVSIARATGMNLGQMQNIIEAHVHGTRNTPEYHAPTDTEIFEIIGEEKTYRVLMTWNGDQYGYLKDIQYSFGQLRQYTDNNPVTTYDLSRIKECPVPDIKSLHDFLVQEQNYVERKIDSMPIEYKGFRSWLSKLKIEGMDTFIPEQTGDLVEIGQKLNNCIGTYKKRVAQGTVTIIAFKQDGEFKMAMNVAIEEPKTHLVAAEFSEEIAKPGYVNPHGEVRIVEFRENHNRAVQDETQNIVRKQLLELFTEYKKELLGHEKM